MPFYELKWKTCEILYQCLVMVTYSIQYSLIVMIFVVALGLLAWPWPNSLHCTSLTGPAPPLHRNSKMICNMQYAMQCMQCSPSRSGAHHANLHDRKVKRHTFSKAADSEGSFDVRCDEIHK